MSRLHHARICIEVGLDDPLPEKISLLTGAVDSEKIVEVEIVYHSKPAHRNPQKINSKKWVAKSLNQLQNCPQAPAHGPGSHCGVEVHPPDQMLDAEAVVEASSAHVLSSGLGIVLCSTAAEAEAEVGAKGNSSGMEGNVDQSSQDGQALPCDAEDEVDTSEYETSEDGSVPGVPTKSFKEGTSEEMSSVAIIRHTSVGGSSDLPELPADRDSDQSPCHQASCAAGSVVDASTESSGEGCSASDQEDSDDGDSIESGKDFQPSGLLPAVAEPLALGEPDYSEESSAADQSSEESSSDCPDLGGPAPNVVVSDANSLPGPLDVPPVGGQIVVVDPDVTPESISRIVQKYSLDGLDHSDRPGNSLVVGYVDRDPVDPCCEVPQISGLSFLERIDPVDPCCEEPQVSGLSFKRERDRRRRKAARKRKGANL